MNFTWKRSTISSGSIVLVDYAATPDGVVERRMDQSLPAGEQTSYRWASYATSPSLDAWTEQWADGPGPSDEAPGDTEWRDVSEAALREVAS